MAFQLNIINRLKEASRKEVVVLSKEGLTLSFSPLEITGATLLFTLGVVMPSIVSEQDFGVLRLLTISLIENNAATLFESAIMLTFANTIRTIPIYLCVLLLSDVFRVTSRQRRDKLLEVLLFCSVSLLAIWGAYSLINLTHNIEYGFGMHSVFVISFVGYIHSQDLQIIKPRVSFFIVSLFVFGVQFLDIVPSLSVFGMGKGELSTYIKNASLLTDSSRVLTIFSITVFLVATMTAFIILRLVVDEYRLRKEMEKKELLEKQLYNTRMEAMEMRAFREIQSLVHDLKAPLTTIQGLASLTKLITDDLKITEYQEKIDSSSEKMNVMISEILYEEKRSLIETDSLIKSALKSVQGQRYSDHIEYINNCAKSLVLVNRIRMVRAIVNLLQNSLAAIGEDGKISLIVNKKGKHIEIIVADNGKGISSAELSKIWEIGYSKSQSTGLGLNFVRSVIINHEGQIDIDSEEGKYTSVRIALRSKDRWKM